MSLLPALLLGVAASNPSTPPDSVVVPMMPVLTVTAARIVHVDLDVPQSVSVVDERLLRDRHAGGVAEALEPEPGVLIQATGNGMDSPFIRGLTGKETLLLVDGMRVNNSTFRYGPNQYLNTVDEGFARRVELVRGPGSVLYGSDALGGVINILSRSSLPDGLLRGGLEMRGGSADGESSVRANAAGRRDAVAWELGGAYKHFDDLEGGGDIGTQANTGYREDALHGRLDVDLASRWRVSARAQRNQLHDLQRTDKFRYDDESYVFNPQRRTAGELRLSLLEEQTPSRGWLEQGHLALNFQRQEEGFRRQRFGSTSVRNYRNDVDTFGAALQLSGHVGRRHRQVVGAEIYVDDVDSWRVDETLDATGAVVDREEKAGNFPDDATYRSIGVYAQNEWRMHSRWDLTTGLRWSATHAEATLEGFGPFEADESALTGSLALGHRLSPRTRVWAGLSTGFRAPNLDDYLVLRSTATGVDVPSPGLDSERMLNYELGVKHRGSRLRSELYVFYADFSDLIARIPGSWLGESVDEDGVPYEQKANLNDAFIYGLESLHQWSPIPRLQLRVGGHYLWGQNESDDEPLRRIPPAQLRLGARWALGWRGSWVDLEGVLTRRQDRLSSGDLGDARIPDGGTPGYQLVHLRAGLPLHAQLRLRVGVENLFDEAYRVHGSGVEGVGRNVYAGLRLIWD